MNNQNSLAGLARRFDHVDRITLSYLFFESDSELPEEYEALTKTHSRRRGRWAKRPIRDDDLMGYLCIYIYMIFMGDII